MATGRRILWLSVPALIFGCERGSPSGSPDPPPGRAESSAPAASPRGSAASPPGGDAPAAEPAPRFRNVEAGTDYVGDEACTPCHMEAAAAYGTHAMSRSFHRWTPDSRIEPSLEEPLRHAATGFRYSVVEAADGLYQVERLDGPDGARRHELRRRMDYVMGSGERARTYFTEENGRLFQLPLTWYRERGWDFSPGYEADNPRFGRLLPDRCLACHGSYPEPIPYLEGKYEELRPGIGCERCHGPGALHVRERSAGLPAGGSHDETIVDPARLPFDRRLEVCEQCHVHTPVTVLREGRGAFDYLPSRPLADHAAFFKATGSIDIVSHADRLRQSACFVATRGAARPLECATCHDPHRPPPDLAAQDRTCAGCHPPDALDARLAGSASRADHSAGAACVGCHMPRVRERDIPHASFTDHWIRVTTATSEPARAARPGTAARPLEPYFERDRVGPEADTYRAMADVVHATRSGDPRLLDDAAAALERALGADTTRADAWFLLGLAHRQLGRTEAAIPALERSLRIRPDDPERLHALARAYEDSGHDPAAIAALYERALELQPALAWIRADHARFLRAHGRREEAEAAYRAALAERPDLAVAAFDLGTLLTGTGRLGEASEAFRRAVHLDPELAEALAPLVHIRVAGGAVTGLRLRGSPLQGPFMGPGTDAADRFAVEGRGGAPVLVFVASPPGASLRILEPDGSLVRTVSGRPGEAAGWDLRTRAGAPVGGGLYRVQVRGRDRPGRALAERFLLLGIVRSDAP